MEVLKITYIIPTYNAESYLGRCLDSIFQQDYPKDMYEVIVADGGSTDGTLKILNKYNVIVVHNQNKIAEDGKFIAYRRSTGNVIAFLDSDNVVATTDWLIRMTVPLRENPGVVGVESNYLIANDFTSINEYANLLVIVDPLARMLASKPQSIYSSRDYFIKTFRENTPVVAGANGFLWRKEIIDRYIEDESKLNEANLLSKVNQYEVVKIANIPNVGIYHYYCNSLEDYLDKRKKIAEKFLNRRSLEGKTWVDSRSKLYTVFCIIYLATFIGPAFEAIVLTIKSRKLSWVWHPIIGFLTVAIYVYYAGLFVMKKIWKYR